MESFFPNWYQAGAPTKEVYANPSSIHPVYPPPTLLAVVPFALLPWPLASKALIGVSTALYLAALFRLSSFVPGNWRDATKPFFLSFGLALAPVHSALHVTNVACLAGSLIFVAVASLLKQSAAEKRVHLVPALLIAFSACLKPTLGLLILPYLLWERAWRTFAVTLGGLAILVSISVFPLLSLGPEWQTDLANNITFVFTNGTADLSVQNHSRFDRIDLQLPIYTVIPNRTAAALLAALASACLLLLWFRVGRPAPRASFDDRLLKVSAVLLIGLLPFYQRFYSAMFVLLPALWAFRNFDHPRLRGWARWTLALCCLYFVNTKVLEQDSGVFIAIGRHLPFLANTILSPHLCWFLLLLIVTLLLDLGRSGAEASAT
jgi:hypothetical protein